MRKLYFDYVRVMAMVAVIGVHLYGSILSAFDDTAVMHVFDSFTTLGVPIFFSLSGFFALQKKIENVKEYYEKRFITIVVPFFFYAFIYVFEDNVIQKKDVIGLFWGPNSYLARVLSGNAYGILWYVYVVSIFYLFAPYLNRLIYSCSHKEQRGLFSVVIAFQLLIPLYVHVAPMPPFAGYIPAFTMFIGAVVKSTIGYVAYNLLNFTVNRPIKLLFVVGSFALYCMNVENAMTLFLFSLYMKTKEKETKLGVIDTIVTSLSRKSYSIYMIHGAAISAYLTLFSKYITNGYVLLLFGYVFVLIAAYLFAVVFDKYVVSKAQNAATMIFAKWPVCTMKYGR